MIARRSSTRLLRSGVSAAALAAAWALPGTAQAQTCTTGATIDGVGPGTAVTCPGGTQLDFPGAVVLGQFTIPNGSTLTGVANGTNPAHQFWFYTTDGVATSVFLQGIYNLRNGIGGTTVLDGPNILGLSGAGSCGAGAQFCPGADGGTGFSGINATGSGGSGGIGRFMLPYTERPDDMGGPGAGGAGGAAYSDIVGDPGCGGAWSCSGATTDSLQQALEPVIERELSGDRCSESGGHCTYVLLPYGDGGSGGAGTFHYGPKIDISGTDGTPPSGASSGDAERVQYGSKVDFTVSEPPPELSGAALTITGVHFNDYLYTDPSGANVYLATDPAVDTGMIAGLLNQHVENARLLQGSSQQNVTGASGSGVQGSFSVPSADGQFLFTTPVEGDDASYVVSFPLVSGETGTYQCDQTGCEIVTGEVDPYDELLQQKFTLPEKFRAFEDVLEQTRLGVRFKDDEAHDLIGAYPSSPGDGRGQLIAALLLLFGDRTSAPVPE